MRTSFKNGPFSPSECIGQDLLMHCGSGHCHNPPPSLGGGYWPQRSGLEGEMKAISSLAVA